MRKSLMFVVLATSLFLMQAWMPSSYAALMDVNSAIYVGSYPTEHHGYGTLTVGNSYTTMTPNSLEVVNDSGSSRYSLINWFWNETGTVSLTFNYSIAGNSYIYVGGTDGTTVYLPTGSSGYFSRIFSFSPSWNYIYVEPLVLSGDGTISISNLSVSPVPEPSTMLLLGSGLAGLIGYGRKRIKM